MNCTDQQLEEIQKNSFKNFHCKGLHYLCLRRNPLSTKKVYFFEGDAAKAPEVVNPHSHRYSFATKVLCGQLQDTRYHSYENVGEEYNVFAYMTPLNGGSGFSWRGETKLRKYQEVILNKGFVPYQTHWTNIHTIKIVAPETVIAIEQFADEVPIDEPTFTYCKEKEPPLLDGLYEKFTVDEVKLRLMWLEGLTT